MILITALISVAVFLAAFSAFRIGSVALSATETARGAIMAMRNPALDEEARERAAKKGSLELFGTFFSILGRSVLTLLAAALPIVAADGLRLASASAVIAFLSRWEVIVIFSVVIATGWYLRKQITCNKAYSLVDRMVHRIAFAAPAVQVIAADVEAIAFAHSYRNVKATRPVFITSLARAGTTMLLEIMHKLPELACHTYRDMPFIFAPVLWSRISGTFQAKSEVRERAHGDGVKIGFDSPEGFEEVIWKAFWPDHYAPDTIRMWRAQDEDPEATSFLREHMKKIISLRRPEATSEVRYLSKNNANIARLAFLPRMFPDAIILIVLRDPLEHAHSLYRQHLNFTAKQGQDAFVKRYMDDIGHYEFGTLHRPIVFPGFSELSAGRHPEQLDYWLAYWIAAFEHIAEGRCGEAIIVPYEEVCAHGIEALAPLCERIGLGTGGALVAATAGVRPVQRRAERDSFDAGLADRAETIYRTLLN